MAKRKAKAASAKLDDKRARARKLVRGLAEAYPVAECALRHANAYELLTATILSAQCTDERVNAVTPSLFQKFPTPAKLAEATQAQVETLIKSTGFFRNKATNLRGMAKAVVERHGGEIPRTLDELTALPGVGRKTANVLLGAAFGISSGVVVDTHVKRISNLFGLTASKNPEIIERELKALLPESEWIDYSHRVIHHGRKVCVARRPRCGECTLIGDCLRVGLEEAVN